MNSHLTHLHPELITRTPTTTTTFPSPIDPDHFPSIFSTNSDQLTPHYDSTHQQFDLELFLGVDIVWNIYVLAVQPDFYPLWIRLCTQWLRSPYSRKALDAVVVTNQLQFQTCNENLLFALLLNTAIPPYKTTTMLTKLINLHEEICYGDFPLFNSYTTLSTNPLNSTIQPPPSESTSTHSLLQRSDVDIEPGTTPVVELSIPLTPQIILLEHILHRFKQYKLHLIPLFLINRVQQSLDVLDELSPSPPTPFNALRPVDYSSITPSLLGTNHSLTQHCSRSHSELENETNHQHISTKRAKSTHYHPFLDLQVEFTIRDDDSFFTIRDTLNPPPGHQPQGGVQNALHQQPAHQIPPRPQQQQQPQFLISPNLSLSTDRLDQFLALPITNDTLSIHFAPIHPTITTTTVPEPELINEYLELLSQSQNNSQIGPTVIPQLTRQPHPSPHQSTTPTSPNSNFILSVLNSINNARRENHDNTQPYPLQPLLPVFIAPPAFLISQNCLPKLQQPNQPPQPSTLLVSIDQQSHQPYQEQQPISFPPPIKKLASFESAVNRAPNSHSDLLSLATTHLYCTSAPTNPQLRHRVELQILYQIWIDLINLFFPLVRLFLAPPNHLQDSFYNVHHVLRNYIHNKVFSSGAFSCLFAPLYHFFLHPTFFLPTQYPNSFAIPQAKPTRRRFPSPIKPLPLSTPNNPSLNPDDFLIEQATFDRHDDDKDGNTSNTSILNSISVQITHQIFTNPLYSNPTALYLVNQHFPHVHKYILTQQYTKLKRSLHSPCRHLAQFNPQSSTSRYALPRLSLFQRSFPNFQFPHPISFDAHFLEFSLTATHAQAFPPNALPNNLNLANPLPVRPPNILNSAPPTPPLFTPDTLSTLNLIISACPGSYLNDKLSYNHDSLTLFTKLLVLCQEKLSSSMLSRNQTALGIFMFFLLHERFDPHASALVNSNHFISTANNPLSRSSSKMNLTTTSNAATATTTSTLNSPPTTSTDQQTITPSDRFFQQHFTLPTYSYLDFAILLGLSYDVISLIFHYIPPNSQALGGQHVMYHYSKYTPLLLNVFNAGQLARIAELTSNLTSPQPLHERSVVEPIMNLTRADDAYRLNLISQTPPLSVSITPDPVVPELYNWDYDATTSTIAAQNPQSLPIFTCLQLKYPIDSCSALDTFRQQLQRLQNRTLRPADLTVSLSSSNSPPVHNKTHVLGVIPSSSHFVSNLKRFSYDAIISALFADQRASELSHRQIRRSQPSPVQQHQYYRKLPQSQQKHSKVYTFGPSPSNHSPAPRSEPFLPLSTRIKDPEPLGIQNNSASNNPSVHPSPFSTTSYSITPAITPLSLPKQHSSVINSVPLTYSNYPPYRQPTQTDLIPPSFPSQASKDVSHHREPPSAQDSDQQREDSILQHLHVIPNPYRESFLEQQCLYQYHHGGAPVWSLFRQKQTQLTRQLGSAQKPSSTASSMSSMSGEVAWETNESMPTTVSVISPATTATPSTNSPPPPLVVMPSHSKYLPPSVLPSTEQLQIPSTKLLMVLAETEWVTPFWSISSKPRPGRSDSLTNIINNDHNNLLNINNLNNEQLNRNNNNNNNNNNPRAKPTASPSTHDSFDCWEGVLLIVEWAIDEVIALTKHLSDTYPHLSYTAPIVMDTDISHPLTYSSRATPASNPQISQLCLLCGPGAVSTDNPSHMAPFTAAMATVTITASTTSSTTVIKRTRGINSIQIAPNPIPTTPLWCSPNGRDMELILRVFYNFNPSKARLLLPGQLPPQNAKPTSQQWLSVFPPQNFTNWNPETFRQRVWGE